MEFPANVFQTRELRLLRHFGMIPEILFRDTSSKIRMVAR
jgi:hypothetical protein